MKEPLITRTLTNKNERTVAEKIHKDGRLAYEQGYCENDNPYEKCSDIYSLKWVAWQNWGNGWRFAWGAKIQSERVDSK
jgi:hypothetical protein